MQISVTFRRMEADEGIREYVKAKVQRLEKYVGNPREAHVVLSVERFLHTAEITMVGDGVLLNSVGKENDLYTAIDQMVEKAERQIREKREKRRKRSGSISPKGVPAAAEEFLESGEPEDLPLIKRRRTLAKPMSLDEAVAQMSVSEKEFMVFFNSDSKQVNVLCRAKNGGLEWLEPYLK
jgi:putative sigma-54 modulation protein